MNRAYCDGNGEENSLNDTVGEVRYHWTGLRAAELNIEN